MDTATSNKQALDNQMLLLLRKLMDAAKNHAAQSVQQILEVSGGFLSEESHLALKSFYDLYFKNQYQQNAINENVDWIFEEAKAKASESEDYKEIASKINVNEQAESARLALSELQKKLEVIISLEQGFREKLGPILSGMQFEDAMSQRFSHLDFAWVETISVITGSSSKTLAEVAKETAGKLSSDAERALFYQTVMQGEQPPTGLGERSVWLDFDT